MDTLGTQSARQITPALRAAHADTAMAALAGSRAERARSHLPGPPQEADVRPAGKPKQRL